MRAIVNYKYGTIYRDVIRKPEFDWCQVMEQEASNLMLAKFVEIMRESFRPIIHKCPYKVKQIILTNLTTVLGNVITFLATGDYKLEIFLHDKNGKWMGDITNMATITTVYKESFG